MNYTVTLTGRSSLVIDTSNQNEDGCLRQLLEASAHDFAIKQVIENTFCTITIRQGDRTKKLIGFPAHLLNHRAPSGPNAKGKATKAVRKVTAWDVWVILRHFGFGSMALVCDSFLPEWPDSGILPRNPKPQLDGNGDVIEAWRVDFSVKMFDETLKDADGNTIRIDIEKQLIDLLPEGLFMDSYCGTKGCTIWLSKEAAL